eukprot:353350-Chlamydomonas_euryale.AAC.8
MHTRVRLGGDSSTLHHPAEAMRLPADADGHHGAAQDDWQCDGRAAVERPPVHRRDVPAPGRLRAPGARASALLGKKRRKGPIAMQCAAVLTLSLVWNDTPAPCPRLPPTSRHRPHPGGGHAAVSDGKGDAVSVGGPGAAA